MLKSRPPPLETMVLTESHGFQVSSEGCTFRGLGSGCTHRLESHVSFRSRFRNPRFGVRGQGARTVSKFTWVSGLGLEIPVSGVGVRVHRPS